MKNEDLTRVKFIKDFEERFEEKLKAFELVNLIAKPEVFSKLDLKPQFELNNIWGLLVFCESGNIYFYVNPYENMMSAMMRVASQGDLPKEQHVCLSDIAGFKVWRAKPHWYDFLIGNSRFELLAELSIHDEKVKFLFTTRNPAVQVLELFRINPKCLKGHEEL